MTIFDDDRSVFFLSQRWVVVKNRKVEDQLQLKAAKNRIVFGGFRFSIRLESSGRGVNLFAALLGLSLVLAHIIFH